MSTESTNPNDLKEQVRDTAHKLAADAQDRARDIRERASDAIDRATGAARDARDKGQELLGQAREKSCDLLGQATAAVRRNPVPVVVGVATLGFAVGYLLCHRRKTSYFDGDDLAAVFSPLGKRLRNRYEDLKDRGSDVFESVQDHLPDHPLDKLACGARSLGKNLKFW